MVKPTPLCLLDEVDAPLDESNTERFINLLAQLAKKIQFITITHNRNGKRIFNLFNERPFCFAPKKLGRCSRMHSNGIYATSACLGGA